MGCIRDKERKDGEMIECCQKEADIGYLSILYNTEGFSISVKSPFVNWE